MSYVIDIDTLNNLVIAKYWGVMDSAEFLDYIIEMENLGPFRAPYQLLLLLHRDLKLTVTTEAVRAAAQRVEVFSENAARVIVAPGSLSYGLSRLFSLDSVTASSRYSVVKRVSDARIILGANEAVLNLEFDIR